LLLQVALILPEVQGEMGSEELLPVEHLDRLLGRLLL
jgi:hypothetical protein